MTHSPATIGVRAPIRETRPDSIGTTAMDIVGHSTIEMTMNVYGHESLDDKRDALDKLSTLLEED